jgi:tripartite-type tricarboxylate transporter receptor subunit TctC
MISPDRGSPGPLMSCGPRASGSRMSAQDARGPEEKRAGLEARGPARRAVLAGALALPFAAHAQTTWPTKPIRIVVPFNPGGAIDALVRIIADGLTAKLGQQVLVDPKPGANTIVGSEIVAKAAPDGYTFLITTNSTHTNNPMLYAKLPFDPAKDLIPVSLVSLGTILVVVKADAPFSDLRGMAKWVKELGRPATYGSWGIGSSGHLYGLMFEQALGGKYSHVPYRGDVPAIQDVSNGTLDITWASPTSAKPQIEARRVKPLAVAGSKRSASMPELPTFAEQLVAGFDLSLFVAAYAPAGTPAEIVDRMSREIKAVISEPAVAEKMIAQGQTPVGSTPKELADMLARETPIWAELIRQSGARVE